MGVQNREQVFLNVHGVLEHHIKIPLAGEGIGLPFAQGAEFLRGGPGQEDVAGNHNFIILPPAGEGKGPGDRDGVACENVHIESDGKFRADFRFNSQKGQDTGICRRLIGPLFRKRALDRVTEVMGRGGGFQIADLHVGFIEGRLAGHPHKQPGKVLRDQGVSPEFLHLFQGESLEGAVIVAAGLPEVLLLIGCVDSHRDGKQGRKQQRGQCNGQHRNNIPGSGGQHGPEAKTPDTASIRYVRHSAHLLPGSVWERMRPSSMRIMRSPIWAISSLWVIMTMVWAYFWLVTFSRPITS